MRKKLCIPILLMVLSLTFTHCTKDPVNSLDRCLERVEDINTALENYIGDPSVKNCQNYVDAIRKYIKADACFGNIYFKQYREELDRLEKEECD